MYQAKIIQKVVNLMWFRNKQDEGVIHEENSSRFQSKLWHWFFQQYVTVLPFLRDVLTCKCCLQIKCCVDEWISGVRCDVPFSTALYKDVYEDHIRCLERFDEVTKNKILPNILLKLYNRGR